MQGNLGERLRRTSAAARVSKVAWQDDVATRDEVIKEADRARWTLAEICQYTDLGDSQVHRILNRQ